MSVRHNRCSRPVIVLPSHVLHRQGLSGTPTGAAIRMKPEASRRKSGAGHATTRPAEHIVTFSGEARGSGECFTWCIIIFLPLLFIGSQGIKIASSLVYRTGRIPCLMHTYYCRLLLLYRPNVARRYAPFLLLLRQYQTSFAHRIGHDCYLLLQ